MARNSGIGRSDCWPRAGRTPGFAAPAGSRVRRRLSSPRGATRRGGDDRIRGCASLAVWATISDHGILASTGSVGDSCAFALAEAADRACRTEPIRRSKPFDSVRELEQATFQWVSQWNHERLHGHPGYRTPTGVEARYHEARATPATQ